MSHGDLKSPQLGFASTPYNVCQCITGGTEGSSNLVHLPRTPACTCGILDELRRPRVNDKVFLSRRKFSLLCFGGLSSLLTASKRAHVSAKDKASNEPGKQEATAGESKCKNCLGSGKVPCELCQGTGFWKAITSKDPRQMYTGVTCPECDGAGTIICPVCLGTGEGNIKGLLRRKRVKSGLGRLLQTN